MPPEIRGLRQIYAPTSPGAGAHWPLWPPQKHEPTWTRETEATLPPPPTPSHPHSQAGILGVGGTAFLQSLPHIHADEGSFSTKLEPQATGPQTLPVLLTWAWDSGSPSPMHLVGPACLRLPRRGRSRGAEGPEEPFSPPSPYPKAHSPSSPSLSEPGRRAGRGPPAPDRQAPASTRGLLQMGQLPTGHPGAWKFSG